MNIENDLNLTVNEPPLKKFKRQIEKKLSCIKPGIEPVAISELSPASLKVQLQADATMMISSQIFDMVLLLKITEISNTIFVGNSKGINFG